MICPKCGERIPDDSVFCQECGYKLAERNDVRSAVHTTIGTLCFVNDVDNH